MSIPKNAIKIFSGELYDVYQRNQQMFDGSYRIFEALKGKDASQILLIFDDGEVGIGYEEQPGCSPFFGLLGGNIEHGEDPIKAVKRELLEETGLGCEEVIPYKTFTQARTVVRYFHCHIGRGVSYINEPEDQSGEKIEVIKISVEELMQILAGPYFRSKDFALDLLKEYYNGGIDRIRAVLGIWDGIIEEPVELISNETVKEKPKRKTFAIKKAKATTTKKTSQKAKKVIIKKKIEKPKKLVVKKKDYILLNKKKIVTKKQTDFKSFLSNLEKKIKKKEVEFEEPLF